MSFNQCDAAYGFGDGMEYRCYLVVGRDYQHSVHKTTIDGNAFDFEDELAWYPADRNPSAPLSESIKRLEGGATDQVNHPDHYTWLKDGVEVIDITSQFSFTLGNALKYIMRAGHKGEALEDLKKARWYVDYEIKRIEDER